MTFALLVTLGVGVLLCFFGYRLFRAAMALSGAVVGGYIGFFVYQLTAVYLPAGDLWRILFIVVGALLLGLLSFKIYKAALFYVTMFVTSIFLLQAYLSVAGGENGLTDFVLGLFRKTPVGVIADGVGNTNVLGTSANEWGASSIAAISGGQQSLWIILGVVLLISVIVAVLVCALQKPAIIVMTSLYGAVLTTQSLFSFLNQVAGEELTDFTALVDSLWKGENPALEIIVLVALAIIGCLVQFKTAKRR